MAKNRFRGLASIAVTVLICILSSAASSADDEWSVDISRYAWMRKDGQRITGNPRLEKQISADKQACLDLLKESASIVPEKNGNAMARGCLAAKGYVLIPRDEIEKRLAEAALTSINRQNHAEKSEAVTRLSDPNKTNQKILAMRDQSRREFFATVILADARQCGDVTRAFYRGSAKPSYNAIWDIECSKGPNYSVLIMLDEKGSSKIMTCGELRATGGGECFVKP